MSDSSVSKVNITSDSQEETYGRWMMGNADAIQQFSSQLKGMPEEGKIEFSIFLMTNILTLIPVESIFKKNAEYLALLGKVHEYAQCSDVRTVLENDFLDYTFDPNNDPKETSVKEVKEALDAFFDKRSMYRLALLNALDRENFSESFLFLNGIETIPTHFIAIEEDLANLFKKYIPSLL